MDEEKAVVSTYPNTIEYYIDIEKETGVGVRENDIEFLENLE